MDKRFFKTKIKLQESLANLIEKKSFYEISITDLCKEADINRNTFYVHYKSTNDLLEEIIHDFHHDLSVDVINTKPHYDFYKILEFTYNHIKRNKVLVSIIKNKELSIYYFNEIYKITCSSVLRALKERNPHVTDDKLKSDVEFAIGGALVVILLWIKQDIEDDLETFTKKIYNPCCETLGQYLQK